MSDILENTIEFKKFLKKLQSTLKNSAAFSLFSIKLYNKARIDDILCCIEASFPDEYKALIKNKMAKKLPSYQMYLQLSHILKGKFPLSSSLYKINLQQADVLISGLNSKIDEDVKFILNNNGNIY